MASVTVAWRRLSSLPAAVHDWTLAVVLTALMYIPNGSQEAGPVALLVTLPLGLRRRWPLPVFIVVMAGAILGGSQVGGPGPGYIPIGCIMVAAYSVGAYATRRLVSLGLLLVAALVVVAIHGDLPPLPPEAAPLVVLFPLFLVGNALRAKQRRADTFEDRATRLERDRESALRAAIADERARIARELHDVVAHSVSVMVIQAGAARKVMDTAPGEATQALVAVESMGREAMSELRKMLGLLSDAGTQPLELTPQPGLDQLEPLVRRVEEAGLPVELRIKGTQRRLPHGLDLTAYRIVQEALTNCLKYSDLAPTEVNLEFRDQELKLEVLDEGRSVPSGAAAALGRGLLGMQERVNMYGGKLEAGPCLERGYAVRAWLPLGTAAS
ncbi:MAG TPA: histidine kinase [Chloroflexota bacterium]|nr:histidine kinase [Chloroflexota bacterium]